MNKVNLAEVVVNEVKSPKGRFRLLRQEISRALTQQNGLGKDGLLQPFEVELVRLPAGARNWPYHAHSAQWEFYLVISGRGQVRTPAGSFEVHDSDCILHPPQEPHQLTNTGAADLVYCVVADNPRSDVCRFPDTNKWMVPGADKPARLQESSFYDGEE